MTRIYKAIPGTNHTKPTYHTFSDFTFNTFFTVIFQIGDGTVISISPVSGFAPLD